MFDQIDDRLLRDEQTLYAIGCDSLVCQTLKALARPLGLRWELYASTKDLLRACDPQRPGCVFLDVRIADAGDSGLFERLAEGAICLPVTLLAAGGDVAGAVRAIRAGAFNYLPKPWTQERLADALQEALHWDAENRAEVLEYVRIHRRLARLNAGEQEVLGLLTSGMSNKGIAVHLGISVRTVETRRAHLMRKTRAKSLAQLLRQAFTVRRRVGKSGTAAAVS